MEKDKRYFIVFYEAINTITDRKFKGWCGVNTDGSYVSLKEIKKDIKDYHKGFDLKDIMPTNIIELNESDYNDFINLK